MATNSKTHGPFSYCFVATKKCSAMSNIEHAAIVYHPLLFSCPHPPIRSPQVLPACRCCEHQSALRIVVSRSLKHCLDNAVFKSKFLVVSPSSLWSPSRCLWVRPSCLTDPPNYLWSPPGHVFILLTMLNMLLKNALLSTVNTPRVCQRATYTQTDRYTDRPTQTHTPVRGAVRV